MKFKIIPYVNYFVIVSSIFGLFLFNEDGIDWYRTILFLALLIINIALVIDHFKSAQHNNDKVSLK